MECPNCGYTIKINGDVCSVKSSGWPICSTCFALIENKTIRGYFARAPRPEVKTFKKLNKKNEDRRASQKQGKGGKKQ